MLVTNEFLVLPLYLGASCLLFLFFYFICDQYQVKEMETQRARLYGIKYQACEKICLKKMFCLKQNEEIVPFKDFLSTLRSSVTAVHSALEEVNIAQLSDELLELNLVELDNEVNDCEKKTYKVSNQNRGFWFEVACSTC